jgi:uroporphyrinogen-III decarboxylase
VSVAAFVATDDVAGETMGIVTHAEWDSVTLEEVTLFGLDAVIVWGDIECS